MDILFLIMAALALVSGLGVVLFSQPLYSALSLVLNLVVVACLYASLGAHFLAVTQMIVYAGAIMVLVIFVILLLSIHGSEKRPIPKFLLPIAAAGAIGFLWMVVPLLQNSFNEVVPDPVKGAVMDGSVEAFGKVLFTDYVFPFEAASILIMAAIVGSVVLARRSTEGVK